MAAELANRGFTVSLTSRSAKGADLLVTDQSCNQAFSVEVKTNSKRASFWLLSKGAEFIVS
ncbi:MAG: aspartate ammonia-lyase, partial [bacterium]|nr:aspartate ammonia-lyase [bacterium]